MTKKALLALADGTVFYGKSIGWVGQACAELVFNTAMTGYQEILTDPSYAEQMVLLTYPHIGNTGINADDNESANPHAKGLIIRDYPEVHSNWRAEEDLSHYLVQHRIVGISDVDTRQLTKHVVHQGAQNACLQAGELDADAAVAAAKAQPSLAGCDLAVRVTCTQAHSWTLPTVDLTAPLGGPPTEKQAKASGPHIVVVDFGVKHSILRLLAARQCRITVVPAQTGFDQLLAHKPDAVVLSNGPGDPAACTYAIALAKQLMQTDMPLLGICLGFQIMALAAGGKTFKMTFGHHGANHPIQESDTGRVFITSQNHGFAVEEDSLDDSMRITHRSLFDGTIQAIRHQHKPIIGFQGHPEGGPGPHDLLTLFDQFVETVNARIDAAKSTHHA